MAEAIVTLKLYPDEYDLVRESLRDSAENARLDIKNPEAQAASRAVARAHLARISALLAKIG